MKGAKRFAASDPVPDSSETELRNKRIMEGSLFDIHRTEQSQQQSTPLPPLDAKRAASSQQYVRALNNQFASWVQTQLKNHPEELWEDGIRDYLAHASNIMEKFSDVVNWLKANAVKGGPVADSLPDEKTLVPEIKNNESKLFQEKTGFALPSTSTSFTSSWSSGVFSANQSSRGVASSCQSSSLFSNGQSSGSLLLNNPSSVLSSNNQSSGFFSNSQSPGLLSNNQSSGAFSNSQSLGALSNSQTPFSFNQSSGTFPNSQSLGALPNTQTSFLFGGQSSIPTNHNTADDTDDENELQQPGSSSVKKSEEKGIVTVHEVKCKLYVKIRTHGKIRAQGSFPSNAERALASPRKESKPTIVVRNDGDDSGNSDSVVARTFLIRTKTEEDRNKLATAIQEYAPTS